MTKFSMELKKFCTIRKYVNVQSKVKKVLGKTPQVWIGIRPRTDDL